MTLELGVPGNENENHQKQNKNLKLRSIQEDRARWTMANAPPRRRDHLILSIISTSQHRRTLLVIATALLLSVSLFNDVRYLLTSSPPSTSATNNQESPFVMCDRPTPLNSMQQQLETFLPRWNTQNKLLLLRKDDYLFGNIGHQINSLFHELLECVIQ